MNLSTLYVVSFYTVLDQPYDSTINAFESFIFPPTFLVLFEIINKVS